MTLIDSLRKDTRVMLYAAAVLLALILIFTPIPGYLGANHGLKYGLDLEGGSWLQLQLEGAIVELDVQPEKILSHQFSGAWTVQDVSRRGDSYVVTIGGKTPSTLAEDLNYPGARAVERSNVTRISIPISAEGVVVNYLKSALDADVKVVGVAPIRYEIRTNVTPQSLNALLALVNGSIASGEEAFVAGLTQETVDETKEVLDKKLNRLGLKDIRVKVVGTQFILIDLAGVNVSTAEEVVGKPGKFEIRIFSGPNETRHVVYGDAVESVDIPRGDRTGSWGVPFTLSDEGANTFQRIAKEVGATRNPRAHEIAMYLDKDQIFSAPLAPDLASSLDKAPMRSLVAEVGGGDEGSRRSKELYIHLREGALPVNVKVIGSGQVDAALGSQFKFQLLLAGFLALLAVGAMIFYRYRERRIVLPMVATSFTEVIMMLGIWSLAGWQLDLASIAGIIMVIGTGVDHLFIITDEVIRGEKQAVQKANEEAKGLMVTGKIYLARLSRAFYIIMGAAATTVAGMLPLLWMGFGALTGFALIIIIGVLIGVGIARPAYGRIIGYILGQTSAA
ncbi:MAG: Protein-export membrane protein SecD [Methanosaeta sp. PtaB.Bin039]|nr:MAG: Protein-export membrane protein SecD [Methanosaeta sp. PtaB.Bin039]OPY45921.1 MAG: Protein-export membrane protein SecD [Methanosaeta sp. PtaU1.Bin028]HOT06894.1 preprotein translocase subunit SecD [Methanotrichaceae archaeon]HQF16484.1 preprotein translocase subunit SecD [Methanotrichaceae archaeon]HQI91907.1 preprotein translocase subunit SecD [Methanotrichaceae archaeon]